MFCKKIEVGARTEGMSAGRTHFMYETARFIKVYFAVKALYRLYLT